MEIQTALRGLRSSGEISNTRMYSRLPLGGHSNPTATQADITTGLGRPAGAEADAYLARAHALTGTHQGTKVTGEGVISATEVVRASGGNGSLRTRQGRCLKALLGENSGLGILLQSVSPPPFVESPSRVVPKGF